MIIKRVPLEDHLNLKLVSKQISAVVKDVVKVSELSREEQIKCHTKLEVNAPRGRCYSTLTCFSCGKMKDKSEYIDAQRKKKVSRRICIDCATRRGWYGRRIVHINGKPQILLTGWNFTCTFCSEVFPELYKYTYDPWTSYKGEYRYCRDCWVSPGLHASVSQGLTGYRTVKIR